MYMIGFLLEIIAIGIYSTKKPLKPNDAAEIFEEQSHSNAKTSGSS